MNKMWDWARSMWHKPSIYMQYRRFSIFKGLNSFQLYLIHGLMHKREFKAGEVLYEVGYPMEVVYFVEKGEICLNDGGQIIGKNQVLGLWDLFVGESDTAQPERSATSPHLPSPAVIFWN